MMLSQPSKIFPPLIILTQTAYHRSSYVSPPRPPPPQQPSKDNLINTLLVHSSRVIFWFRGLLSVLIFCVLKLHDRNHICGTASCETSADGTTLGVCALLLPVGVKSKDFPEKTQSVFTQYKISPYLSYRFTNRPSWRHR